MLTANLSGYPTKPSLQQVRSYITQGGQHPFDIAVREAIKDQLLAGLDIITDGQVRDVISIFALHVQGMELNDRPIIRNKLGLPDHHSTVSDFVTALKEVGDPARVKAVLPGPFSFVAKCELDTGSTYRTKEDVDLIFDVSKVIKYEIEALRDNQASVIQIVESLDYVHDIEAFTELLNYLFRKVKSPVCHISGDINACFLRLLDTPTKVISFDLVTYPKNSAVIKFTEEVETYEKTLALGCVNASAGQVEPLYEIEQRIIRFVESVDSNLIWLSPNESLSTLSREIAFKKLRTLRDLRNSIVSRLE